MAFSKILVPTDGSELTKSAVRKAMELAEMSNGTVTALYVLDQSVFSNMPLDSAVMNVYTVMEKEAKQAVDFVRGLGAEMGVPVEEKIMEGSPVRSIIEVSPDYDVIIMGSLGRTGMSKLLMGSVAEKVVRGAMCPVMVVRSPEAGKQ